MIREIIIIVITILCSITNVRGQTYGLPNNSRIVFLNTDSTVRIRTDTVACLMLYSDTSMKYSISEHFEMDDKQPFDGPQLIRVKIIRDTTARYYVEGVYWMFGYSVREKHNTDEGQIDPYHTFGYVSRDYWVHLFYLDADKKPLSKNIIIWMSMDRK